MPLFKHYISADVYGFEKAFARYAERELAGIVWPPKKETGIRGLNAL